MIWFFGHLLLCELTQEKLPPPWTLGRGAGVGGLGWLARLGWARLGWSGLAWARLGWLARLAWARLGWLAWAGLASARLGPAGWWLVAGGWCGVWWLVVGGWVVGGWYRWWPCGAMNRFQCILYRTVSYLALKTMIVQSNTKQIYTIGLAAAAAAA